MPARLIIILVFISGFSLRLSAQDTIFTRGGNTIVCAVLSQDTVNVICKTLDSSALDIKRIPNKDILRISYDRKYVSDLNTQSAPQSNVFKLDTIIAVDGKKTLGKVMEIDADYITYVTADSSNAERFLFPVSNASQIHYAAGINDILGQLFSGTGKLEYYRMGANDAMLYYNSKKDFRRGVFAGAMTYVFYSGIVILIIEHRKPPLIINEMANPNNELLIKNQDYRQGYSDVAKEKKRKKLNQGYAVGVFATPVAFIVGTMFIFAFTL
ncbi:MAG: hypothetical protein Fur0041_01110 [Bacteroidia bacterium]